MVWDKTVRFTDVAIVFATLVGPILGIQAQAFLDRRRAQRNRQEQIVHTLMRTRASTVSPDHVQALNSIPLEFRRTPKVVEAYRAYIAHVNTQSGSQAWGEKRTDLLLNILVKMAQQLDYDFDAVQLKGEFYAPQ